MSKSKTDIKSEAAVIAAELAAEREARRPKCSVCALSPEVVELVHCLRDDHSTSYRGIALVLKSRKGISIGEATVYKHFLEHR